MEKHLRHGFVLLLVPWLNIVMIRSWGNFFPEHLSLYLGLSASFFCLCCYSKPMVLSGCVKTLCWRNLKSQNSCSPMWWSIYRVEESWMLIFVNWSPHRLLLHFVIRSILIILGFHLSQQLSSSCDVAWAYKQKQIELLLFSQT